MKIQPIFVSDDQALIAVIGEFVAERLTTDDTAAPLDESERPPLSLVRKPD